MNLRAVSWVLGCVMLLLAVFLMVPALVSEWYGERESMWACIVSALLSAALGAVLTMRNRGATLNDEGRADYFRREGLAMVGLSWLVVALIGALPFILSGAIPSPVDAFFESASGFTTTGSTILEGHTLDHLPRGIAFWRSFTHWLGGIGIVLVFVVLFPTGGRSLFRSEVPGIAREAVQARVRDSALGLARIYVGLTLVLIALLIVAGLSTFDAFVHAFGTLATGGFSSYSDSVAHFDSWLVEAILIAFMFMAGINFAVYDNALRFGFRAAWRRLIRSGEFWTYTLLITGSIAMLTMVLWFWGGSNGDPTEGVPDYRELSSALRDTSFLVVSLQTSTGYGTADFDRWPEFCRVWLMFLAMVGACAGSTGGGLKVVRFLILARASIRGIREFARPRAIHTVRVDGRPLEESMVASIIGYCGLWMLMIGGGTLALAAMNIDLVTASTATLACLNNIGPGLGLVGPTQNFAFMPDVAKAILAIFMIVGRLEFYAVVVLFVPGFWRR